MKMNELSLDGRLLKMFVTVYKTTSVTEAAYRLDVTQSTVSHGLARLRKITDDPLFVASGRGIVPTSRAHALAKEAEDILTRLAQFTKAEQYDPDSDHGVFAIAGYDFVVESLLKPVLPVLRQRSPYLSLHIKRAYGRKEWLKVLRENRADLAFTLAEVAVENDLNQQILFEDHYVCFYDASHRSAPDSLDAYIKASHAVITSGGVQPSEIDKALALCGGTRQVALEAPSFGTLATLIKGTDIIATMPSCLKDSQFSGFAFVDPPVELPTLQIAQVWHNHNTACERHRWFRQLINDVVNNRH